MNQQRYRWIDVSITIDEGMINWPSNPPPQIALHKSLARGDKANVSTLFLCVHSGTHLDFPGHSLPSTTTTSPPLDLQKLIGRVRVFDLPSRSSISRADLTKLDWQGVERVIFRTDNVHYLAAEEFYPQYVYIEPDAARFLVEKNICLVGIDYFSVEKYKAEEPQTHEILLSAGILVLEGLDLREVKSGDYHLLCLPLKVNTVDGAPARVLLGAAGQWACSHALRD